MKKIWQKSLASMVSAALCLTAFVGCLTVNAADYQGTITSAGASVTTEDTQAIVTLALTSPAAMNVAAIAATSEYGTLTSVTENEEGYYIDDTKLLSKGKFFVDANDNEAGFNTANVVLTFTKAEGVVANTYPVTVTYFAGESAATWAEETVELVVDSEINIVVTEPVVEPEEDYITYTSVAYDVAKSELSIGRAAPSQKLKDALSEGTANGNRKQYVVVDVNGSEYLFDTSITSGTGTFKISGFAITDINVPVSVYVRITADNDYLVNTNSYNIVLGNLISEMSATDAKAAALLDLIDVWSSTDESIAVSNAVVETGLVDYTTISYNTKANELVIGRAAPSQELKDALSEGTANGNRKQYVVVDVNGSEYLFATSFTSGAGAFKVSGFALPDFAQNVKIYVRITSGASGEYVVNTNAVNVNLNETMQSTEGSTFADAYNTYYAVQ
ncbi:MAG: hypothetical protein ACI4F7_12545 [Acutalibacteraceae bacterium]